MAKQDLISFKEKPPMLFLERRLFRNLLTGGQSWQNMFISVLAVISKKQLLFNSYKNTMMIKKLLLLPLSLVFIFFGCKKEADEADVAGLLIGKWNYNASTFVADGKKEREEANDCGKKSFMEFASGGAYHEENYTDRNSGGAICEHTVSDLKSYEYDAASKKLTLTGGKWNSVYKVISISKNKLIVQLIAYAGSEWESDSQTEYIR